jgi:predicted transcriptional regulator
LFGVNVAPVALATETLKIVSTRLAVQGLERIPVVDDPKRRRLVGIVSRSDLVKPSLNTYEEEERREVFRSPPFGGRAQKVKAR